MHYILDTLNNVTKSDDEPTSFTLVGNEADLEAKERTSRDERAIRPHALLYFTRRGGMASEG